MTAEEMFNELGLIKNKRDKSIIYYFEDYCYTYFEFYLDTEELEMYVDDSEYDRKILSSKVLRAINKQCEELGWL